jgi:hypothetical protein
MRSVYDAAHLADAVLVRDGLEDAGIPAFILGESLLGGLGQLPAYGLVQVAVPDSLLPAAREWLQARAEPAPEPEGADWGSASCGWLLT